MRFLLTLAVLFLMGCAPNPKKVAQVAEHEASTLPAPSRSLSTFASFELKPMIFADAIRAHEGKIREGQEFERNLQDEIGPVLREWNERGTGMGTLVIEPTLRELRVISGGNRFWAGRLAGKSFIDLELGLTDGESGDSIGVIRFHRSSGGVAGAWSFGKTDQNLDEYIVSIVREYLLDHY